MLDALLLLDGTLPNTGAAITATRASTNVIDMLTARDVGVGDELDIHVQVMVTGITATSLQVAFQGSVDNSAWTDILLSPVILTANVVAGAKIFRVKWPVEQLNSALASVKSPINRYYRLNYTVAGSNFANLTVMAWVSGGNDRQCFIPYPANYAIAS